MGRLVRDVRGQSLLSTALFMAFIGLLLMAAIGIAVAYNHLAQVQAAADAAVLAGAREVTSTEVSVGPYAVCRFAEIDPSRAVPQAQAFWTANLSASPLITESFATEILPQQRPTRFSLFARVRLPIGVLGVIGKPILSLPVMAEATVEQECENTVKGPVFAQNRAAPPGWPVPGADWVWNWPAAEFNAPVAWPVYFVTVFTLEEDRNITVYAAGDADYEVGIDTEVLFTGSGTAIKSESIDLPRGSHMLWVKATNEAPDTPFSGPNPAGIIVGAVDDRSEVVAVTRGNAIEQAGRPVDPDDWGSWSPPNPDWTVYADPFYPSGWIIGAEELVSILKDMGFTHRNAADLRSWMLTVLGMDRAYRTVTVMAQDMVPDTIVATPDENAILRHYLNGGGNVLWMGNVPLYSQGHADGSRTDWGTAGQEQVLGLPNPTTYWYTSGDPMDPEPTAAGQRYGIGREPWWEPMMSGRAVAPYCWLQPLATISSGGVSAWRMSYWPLEPNCDRGDSYIQNAWRENAPGFVRLYDAGVYLYHPPYLVTAMTVAGQMAGWYRGQTRQ